MTEIERDRIQSSFFSRYWVWHVAAENQHAATCIEELARRLGHIDPGSWSERFALGGVYVAGAPAHPDTPILAPCKLEYYEPKFALSEAESFYPQFSPEMIVYMDEDLGIAYKPAGLPTTAARDQQRFNLAGYLRAHLARAVHTPSRLDTAVAGLLIFSLSDRMNRHLQKAYEKRSIEKYYLCEVGGVPAWQELDITHALGRDRRHAVLRRVVEEGGDLAHTKILRLKSYNHNLEGRALLQVKPLTGRTHQIRVHCAAEGLPIVGDPLYGGAQAQDLRLVSYALRFHHPYKQREVEFELPLALRPEWLQDIEQRVGGVSIVYPTKEIR